MKEKGATSELGAKLESVKVGMAERLFGMCAQGLLRNAFVAWEALVEGEYRRADAWRGLSKTLTVQWLGRRIKVFSQNLRRKVRALPWGISLKSSRKVELPCVPHGWGNLAGRVDTPASPVLPLEGAGREGLSPSRGRAARRARTQRLCCRNQEHRNDHPRPSRRALA